MTACIISLMASVLLLERILLPVSTPEIPGAFGARFVTEHFIRNDGSAAVVIARDDCGDQACEVTIPPAATRVLDISHRRHLLWITVPADAAERLYLSTMVRDVSRAVEPWGTEIPAVRESEFRTGRLQILNVPSDPAQRLNLRMYALPEESSAGQPVDLVVRLFDLDADLTGSPRLVGERTYTFRNTPLQQGDDFIMVLDLRAEFPDSGSASRLRVEMTSAAAQRKFWALVTATNNGTQHITIFTPQ